MIQVVDPLVSVMAEEKVYKLYFSSSFSTLKEDTLPAVKLTNLSLNCSLNACLFDAYSTYYSVL